MYVNSISRGEKTATKYFRNKYVIGETAKDFSKSSN
jgi:hypothetical protein